MFRTARAKGLDQRDPAALFPFHAMEKPQPFQSFTVDGHRRRPAEFGGGAGWEPKSVVRHPGLGPADPDRLSIPAPADYPMSSRAIVLMFQSSS